MSKYDELKAAAEAATKGDWSVDRLAVTADTRSLVCCGQAYLECCGNPDVDGDEYDPICSATSESDAAYIASANPVAILELIEEVEALREKASELNVEAVRYRYLATKTWSDDVADALCLQDKEQIDNAVDAAVLEAML